MSRHEVLETILRVKYELDSAAPEAKGRHQRIYENLIFECLDRTQCSRQDFLSAIALRYGPYRKKRLREEQLSGIQNLRVPPPKQQ